MSYHVAIDLTPEQVRQLKLVATAAGLTVKEFVARAILEAIKKETKNVKEE